MNCLRTFIFSLLLLGSIAARAERLEMLIIFNGYFFDGFPSRAENDSTPCDMVMFSIETPNKAKALCMYSPTAELPDEFLQAAIPVENVAEGAELLRRYNEQKENLMRMRHGGDETARRLKVGDPFPDFSATDIAGKTWTSADVDGRVMVLNLWFTGCGPCRGEMPELSGWKNEMLDVMFFSSTYEAPEIARQVLDKVDFNWIPLVNNTQFTEYIGSNGYPLTVIVDKSGRIAAFEYGTSPEKRAALKNKIRELR